MIRRPPRSTLFPTRRSSDLDARRVAHPGRARRGRRVTRRRLRQRENPGDGQRSEEHTSELQSQSNLVCRLLLEKKKPYWSFVYASLGSACSVGGLPAICARC